MKASSAESQVNAVRSGMPIEPSPGPCRVASPVRWRIAMCRFVMSEYPMRALGFAAMRS